MPTFGEIISEKRKEIGLSQKELAAQVFKEDAKPISQQYLNDLEHSRRNPPGEYLIEQFAKVLKIAPERLYYCIGEFPPDAKCDNVPEEQVVEAFKAFRKVIEDRTFETNS